MTMQTLPTTGIGRNDSSILRAAGRRLASCLARIATTLTERDARYRANCRLATLDDHLLQDMGLTRDAVRSGAAGRN